MSASWSGVADRLTLHLLFKCIYTCTFMWSGAIWQQSHHSNHSLMPAVKGSIRRGCQQRKVGMGWIKTPAECCSNSMISPANDNCKFKSVPHHRLRSGEQSLLFKVTTKQRRGKRLSQHLLALIGELKGAGGKKRESLLMWRCLRLYLDWERGEEMSSRGCEENKVLPGNESRTEHQFSYSGYKNELYLY